MKPWCSLLLGLFLGSGYALRANAQISLDGTTNTTLTPTDNGIRIDEGDRAGNNLFHSFRDFSVPNGNEAFFNNAADISNIFSRVTGGNISNIDGLLRANGDANLFIINPAGIIFGENASLNIGGSFFATTAERILFPDGIEFSAIDSQNPPLLTINQPLGLGLSDNPGAIVNESTADAVGLQVTAGNNLTFVGGNINFVGGRIFAPGGNVELGGLLAAGEIGINPDGSLNFPEGLTRADVILTNGAEVNVLAEGGGNITINAANIELSSGELGQSFLQAGIEPNTGSADARAGDITLNATNNINVRDSDIRNVVEELGEGNGGDINLNSANLFLTQGGLIFANTVGIGDAGNITINARDTVAVEGENPAFSSGITSQVGPSGVGNAGVVDITATNVSLSGGGFVDVSSFGMGNAGIITISAADTITMEGEDSFGFNSGIFSLIAGNSDSLDIITPGDTIEDSVIAEGNAGKIEIKTTNLFLKQGAIIGTRTFGVGDAGKIIINASESIVVSGEDSAGFNSLIDSSVFESAEGNAGNIDITTTHLSLIAGGQISSSTFGVGNAGIITIDVLDMIVLDGESPSGVSSGIFSTIESSGEGDGGNIEISTNNLHIRGNSRITATNFGVGNGGIITINASDTISIEGELLSEGNSGIFSTVSDEAIGDGGDITITASDLTLTNKGSIAVDSTGEGTAGDLFIQANSLALETGASLLASTPVGTGGNITLEIADDLTLRDNSTISARALQDANGGNIDIDASFVIAFPNQNNDIIANAARGTGGNINITTLAIFGLEERSSTPTNNTNDIDASSDFGLDGTVDINELDVNPAEALEELPTEVVDVARLVAQNLCQQGEGSEFIVTGKGGLAPNPSQARDGDVSEVDLVEPAPNSPPTPLRKERGATNQLDNDSQEIIVEAQGWMINDRGILELIASKTDINGSPAQPKDAKICHK